LKDPEIAVVGQFAGDRRCVAAELARRGRAIGAPSKLGGYTASVSE
jgi:hypothetical protein